MAIPVITIDGPSASGKGTVAHRVALALGWHTLDSGALYRAAALCVLEQGVDVEDAHAVARVAAAMGLHCTGGEVFLTADHAQCNSPCDKLRNISAAIRTESVGAMASRIAAHAPLRAALLATQRAFRQAPGLVADGRDMGSHVFPDANLKIFLVADVATRAQRRYKQLMGQGISVKLADLAQDLHARDLRDRSRTAAPLAAAQGAKIVDSSALDIQQTVDVVLGHWSSLGACTPREESPRVESR